MKKEKISEYRKKACQLVSQMTLEEKIAQMLYTAPSIKRLGVKSYSWWNEALHGVARAGVATVFPQSISLAATFDTELIEDVADVISTEARAKYNEFQRQGDHQTNKGLTFWSPNINIFRDPRWGRGHETYGEDPFLTARLGVAYIKGMQGNDENHLKAAACAKHFAVHSGPESLRHGFNAVVSKKDLYETYLPAFEAAVKEAEVEAVMGAYNSVNDEPCCASVTLIEEILRKQMGFDGHFVSDCGAINDIYANHKASPSLQGAAAMAVNAGCDLNCGNAYGRLAAAVSEGLLDEKAIDKALIRLFTTRYKLGIMDDSECVYDKISYFENNSAKNKKINRTATEKCITLLKNNGLLPLDKSSLKRIAVIGPNADNTAALLGNYNGTPDIYYTILRGIQELCGEDTEVIYAQGCHLFKDRVEPCAQEDDRISEAVSAAQYSDLSILCVGLDATIESEEGDAYNSAAGGDKVNLDLPESQLKLMSAIFDLKKPVIVVNLSGSAVNLTLADKNADAVVQAWYPGALGGLAIADMLFGKFSPSGRLPVTFYSAVDDLPDFADYSMKGRTYRYYEGNNVLYPFGFGLSYTNIEYSDLKLDKEKIKSGEQINCSVKVKNVGNFDSDEVIELYLKDNDTSVVAPKYQLKGFKRIFLKKGEEKLIDFIISPKDMELVLDDGSSVIEKGTFTVFAGSCQPCESTLRKEFEVI